MPRCKRRQAPTWNLSPCRNNRRRPPIPCRRAPAVPTGRGPAEKDVPPSADRKQRRTAAAKPAPIPASPPSSPALATPTALDYLLTQLPPESAASARLAASPAASSGAHATSPGAHAARGSPWFWVGVGGLLFAACMLVFLVFMLVFQTSSPYGIGLGRNRRPPSPHFPRVFAAAAERRRGRIRLSTPGPKNSTVSWKR